MSGPAADPGLKERMHFSIVAAVTVTDSTDISGGGGTDRSVGEGLPVFHSYREQLYYQSTKLGQLPKHLCQTISSLL